MPQTENKAACSAEERQMQKEEDEQGLETIKFVIAGNPDLTDIHRSIDVNFSTTTGGNLIKQVFSEEIEVGWNVRLFCAGRPVLENETLTHARVPRDSFLHAFLANLPPKKEKKPADGAVVKQVPVAQPASVDSRGVPLQTATGQSASGRFSRSGLSFTRRILLCCCGGAGSDPGN
mmetsp:Transcript_10658/g.26095  ORF Transcript_10658/g.26095 Transcript_10658/m.26095 type:complete len:176 (-) Transcript_10658:888-1415(-)